MEGSGEGIQDQAECSTCPGSPGWQACGPDETKEHWSPLPQPQGFLLHRWVDAGTAGSCSDDQIFNASQLKRRIEDGRIGFPDPAPITQGGRDVPYFILADDAFALKRVVENAFGILVSRFTVMRTTIEVPRATVREVVFTCVVLHNILRSQCQGQPGDQQSGDDNDDDVPGDCGLIGGAAGGGQDINPAREAKRQRDYLRDYFNNEGAVAWQDGRI